MPYARRGDGTSRGRMRRGRGATARNRARFKKKRKTARTATARTARRALSLARKNRELAYGHFQMNLHHVIPSDEHASHLIFSAHRPLCYCLEDINYRSPIYQFCGYPAAEPSTTVSTTPHDWVNVAGYFSHVSQDDAAGVLQDATGFAPTAYQEGLQKMYNNWRQPNTQDVQHQFMITGGQHRLEFQAQNPADAKTIRVRVSFFRTSAKQLATKLLYRTNAPVVAGNYPLQQNAFQSWLGVDQFTLPSTLGTFNSRLDTRNKLNFMYMRQIGRAKELKLDPGAGYTGEKKWINFTQGKKVINPRTGDQVSEPPGGARPGMHWKIPHHKRTWCVIETDAISDQGPLDLTDPSLPMLALQRQVNWRDGAGSAA